MCNIFVLRAIHISIVHFLLGFFVLKAASPTVSVHQMLVILVLVINDQFLY
jgi:hypothetical protein